MAELEKKFSELTAAAVLTDADILAISQIDSATASLMSKRTTLIAIANKLASLTNYTSELTTQDKTLTGAINELKGLISLIPHFGIEVVQTLPVEDISETTIYMTPSQNPQTQDAYDEFIYVNDAWEHVGSTAVDLSAYYTKLEVDGLLATKANTADVSTALALKENTADMEEDVTDIVVDLTDTIETAEGNPVTLQTVQEGYAKSATVTLTPKQDLHGYDKPWTGGGGKNKCPVYQASDSARGFWGTSNTDLVSALNALPAGTYTISAKNTIVNLGELTTVQIQGSNVFANGVSITTNRSVINDSTPSVGKTYTSTGTFTISAEDAGNITACYLYFGAPQYGTFTGTITEIQIEAGSTATAYEPYANICPIEGYEEASAMRTGKNKLDPTTIEQGGTDADGNLVNSNIRVRSGYNKVNSAEQYTVSVNDGILVDTINYYTSAKSFISRSVIGQRTGTATTPANTEYMLITFKKQGDGLINPSEITQAQLEAGSTATSYEPYDGATATAEFPETIYGAQGDIAGGEWGKEWEKVVLDGTQPIALANWRPDASGVGWLYNNSVFDIEKVSSGTAKPNVISESLPTISYDSAYGRNIGVSAVNTAGAYTIVIFQSNTSLTTAADINAYLAQNPITICFKKATPEPFQTAPAPLTLRKGDNTITTDGDSVKVKYNKLALPDIGGIGRYISALEARVAALEGGNRSLSLMKSAPIESKEEEPTEENGEEAQEEPKEETKNENTSESK